MTKLTQNQKVIIAAAIIGPVLTSLGYVGIREWYAPDVRYEEGGYYISGQTAITSLKLRNYGHSDAEDIILHAEFNNAIIEDISTSDRILTLNNISGGKGQKDIVTKITRLVPGQEIFIYFAIDMTSLSLNELPKHFLSQITFNDGIGKMGTPFIWSLLFSLAILLPIFILSFYGFFIYQRKEYTQHYSKISDVIAMTDRATSKHLSRKVFETELGNYLQNVKFEQRTLYEIGMRMFNRSEKLDKSL